MMREDTLDENMQILLEKLLSDEEFQLLKEVIKNQGSLEE